MTNNEPIKQIGELIKAMNAKTKDLEASKEELKKYVKINKQTDLYNLVSKDEHFKKILDGMIPSVDTEKSSEKVTKLKMD